MALTVLLWGYYGKDVQIVPPESLDAHAKRIPETVPKGASFRSRPSFHSLPATFIGPQPMYGEPWSDGTVSGRISYVLPHPTDPNTVYIASAGGGVWRTTDGGTTWTPLTDGLPNITGGALAFDPTDPNTVYYGTGEQHYCGWSCLSGDGLYRSGDAGDTWTKIATRDEVGDYVDQIWIRPDNPDVIFVAGNRGLARSTDGGSTWNWVFTLNDVNGIAVRSDDYEHMFIGVYGRGLYESTDGGSTWSRINSLPTSGIGRVELAISPSNPDILYVSFTDVFGGLEGLYKTTDGGLTWIRLTNTPDYLYPQGDYDHAITVHPTHPDTVFAGGVFPYDSDHYGIVRTFDGGNTWTDVTDRGYAGRVHPDIHHFAWGADGALYVACDGGLWRSYDYGDSWENLNEGLGITQFYTLDVHPVDPDLIAGGTQDNGTAGWYSPWGEDWTNIRAGDGGPVLWFPFSPDSLLTTYINMSGMAVYEWDGSDFRYTSYIGTPWPGERACWACGPLEADPTGNTRTVFAGTYRLWRSTDGGLTWSTVSGSLVSSPYGYLMSMAVSSTTDTIYVGSSSADFKVSFDGGSTWVDRTLPDISGWEDIFDIAVNPNNAAEVYATISQASGAKVVRSNDAGATWTDISGDLPNTPALALEVDFTTTPHTIYVGTHNGLYYSVDQNTYTKITSVPSTAVYDLGIDPTHTYLIVATHGRGMWRVRLPASTDVVERTGDGLRGFSLRRGVLKSEKNLTVYDLSGRLVASLPKGGRITLNRGVYFVYSEGRTHKVVIR